MITPTDAIREFLEVSQGAPLYSDPLQLITKPEEIAAGIAQIRRAAMVEAERYTMLCDCVRVAADQVQDVRIELLERGPEVTALQVLLPVLIVFCFETALAGALVAGATKIVLSGLIREQRVGRNLGTHGLAWLSRTSRVDTLAQALTEKAILPALKTAYSYGYDSPDAPKGEANLDHKDTAGVSIQDAALWFASELRLRSGDRYAQLEQDLLAHRLSRKALDTETRLDPIENIAAVRLGCRCYFEAVIWAALFRFGHKNGACVERYADYSSKHLGPKYSTRFYTGELEWLLFRKEGDSRLLRYWAERLINPASGGTSTFAEGTQPWPTTGGRADFPFSQKKEYKVTFEQVPDAAMLAAGQYLGKLGKKLLDGPTALVHAAPVPLPSAEE